MVFPVMENSILFIFFIFETFPYLLNLQLYNVQLLELVKTGEDTSACYAS